MRKRTVAVSGATGVAVVAVAAGAWLALAPAGAETTASCDVAYVEVATEHESGATELELELTSNTPGEAWTIRVEHDGRVVHESDRVTDDDAEIDVELRRPGSERTFTVLATPASGTPCTLSVPPT
jgi:hypothetical protein